MQLDAFGYDDVLSRALQIQRDAEAVVARNLTQRAIDAAADHADRVASGWTDKAYGILLAFSSACSHPFAAEDVRREAAAAGLEEPPDPRAWGAVLQAASRDGLLVRVGFGESKNKQAHCRPVALWMRRRSACS